MRSVSERQREREEAVREKDREKSDSLSPRERKGEIQRGSGKET